MFGLLAAKFIPHNLLKMDSQSNQITPSGIRKAGLQAKENTFRGILQVQKDIIHFDHRVTFESDILMIFF